MAAYILDTNVISDWLKAHPAVTDKFEAAVASGDTLYLCQPVHYEVIRGLNWKKATAQMKHLQSVLEESLTWLSLTDADWLQAAQLWSQAVSAGKQLHDTDLLVASLANRLDAVIVSADDDFDALSVRRENWRQLE